MMWRAYIRIGTERRKGRQGGKEKIRIPKPHAGFSDFPSGQEKIRCSASRLLEVYELRRGAPLSVSM
jgi:hypothetical protein